MAGQGTQPEPEPIGAQPKATAAGPMVMSSYTVTANFGTSGTTTSVTVDLSTVDDMGGDDVTVYAATGATPGVRRTGAPDRRVQWPSAPPTLPSDQAGGSSINGSNYWVQVVNGTDEVWYEGNVTAAAGVQDFRILKRDTW